MRIDPNALRQQISNLLLRFPELAEDDVLRADMIEGETEAYDVLARLVRDIEDTKALADGTDARIDELRERAARFGRRLEAYRALAFTIMETANLPKVELPTATLSIRAGTPKVIITDEGLISDLFCKFTRSPDKTKIKQWLTDGMSINGAELSNGEASLAVRVK